MLVYCSNDNLCFRNGIFLSQMGQAEPREQKDQACKPLDCCFSLESSMSRCRLPLHGAEGWGVQHEAAGGGHGGEGQSTAVCPLKQLGKHLNKAPRGFSIISFSTPDTDSGLITKGSVLQK